MSLTNYERETIIIFNEAEPMAEVFTCNKALIRRLNILCQNIPEFVRGCGDENGLTYTIPKKYVSIAKPRYLSDETRQKKRDNAMASFLITRGVTK